MRVFSCFVGLLCVLCVPAGVHSQEQPTARIQQVEQGLSLPIQINNRPVWTLQERMKRRQVPGLSIAVIRNFQVDWAKGYGVRDARTGEPVTETTRFQWASITKPMQELVFTAAGMKHSSIGPPSSDLDRQQRSMAHVRNGVPERGYGFLVGGSGCCELWATPTTAGRACRSSRLRRQPLWTARPGR
jgi:CubicO group peptidase (beta-lactamase class C family)